MTSSAMATMLCIAGPTFLTGQSVGRASGAATVTPVLQRCMDQLTAERGFSGAVLVAQGDSIRLHQGYGWLDRRTDSRIQPDTKFYVASISKQFAAAATLKLEEQGRLRVEDSISKYLTNVPPDKAAITVHQLLTHTSGIGQAYAADGIVDRDEAVRAVLKLPLRSAPGGKFNYANDGYTLLAAIIEVVSGQRFETYLRRQLLEPAGLSHTGFWGDSVPAGDSPIAPIRKPMSMTPNWGFRGATGMYSTAGDLERWWRGLQAHTVLAKGSVDRMMTPYVTTSAGGYGYGWFASKTTQGLDDLWTAGLEDFGHNAKVSTYSNGTVIIVASNAGYLGAVPARDVATHALETVLFGPSDSVSIACAGPRTEPRTAPPSSAQVRRIVRPLDTIAGLVPHGVMLSGIAYRGRRALHVVNDSATRGQAFASVAGTAMTNGTVDVDVAGMPKKGASAGARGFIGVAFRVTEDSHFECFYIRPTNGRANDQLRRNHATQYMASPDFPFDRSAPRRPACTSPTPISCRGNGRTCESTLRGRRPGCTSTTLRSRRSSSMT